MVTLEEMLDAGVHFGHQARRWNPKMEAYIYGQRNGIHIIDILKTRVCLEEAGEFLFKTASESKKILFVGTKRQAANVISVAASQSNSFFVNQRWLGGMLTNWSTMKVCIQKLNALEKQFTTGIFDQLPKKEAALRKKQLDRLSKYLGGVKGMTSLPDVVIIVGQSRELNAVHECNRLGIRTITILDTNSNPDLADYFIPANDDSLRSIELILTTLSQAIQRGQTSRKVLS